MCSVGMGWISNNREGGLVIGIVWIDYRLIIRLITGCVNGVGRCECYMRIDRVGHRGVLPRLHTACYCVCY